MSGRKAPNTTTKIPVDVNADSGYLSGPISEQLSEEFPHIDSDSSTQITNIESTHLDSGVDICLSEEFSNVKLSEGGRNNFDDTSTPTAQSQPTLNIIKEQEKPPLDFLFQQDDDGDTQLHIAAVHGCAKSVGTLVRVCPDQEWYNVPNDYGQTALHLAALSGHAVVTRMLVLAGASISIRDLAGDTPLHVAAAAGHNECLQALLAPIANEPHRRLAVTLNQKNYNGQSCVHVAALAGHLDVLQTLVFYGADINAREGLCGRTALHVAAARGDARTAAYLLERCAGVAGEMRDYAGRTPRRLAASPAVARLFHRLDTDSESDDDDDLSYDSDQSLFDKLREGMNPINVA